MLNSTPPKISVITVCYNPGNKIVDTINSVLAQTYPCIEYIIIDGASTDTTPGIINVYRDKVKLVISEPDSGIYDAMNKGIRHATGELIIFLNAGDYYISPTVLEYAITKVDLARADVFFARFVWESPVSKDIVLSDHSWVRYDWDLKSSNFPHPATFYKRKLFSKVGGFDTKHKIIADYEWNVRALVKNRVPFMYLNIITARFTADGISNIASNKTQIDEEIIRITNAYYQPTWLFKFCDKYLKENNYFQKWTKKIIANLYSKTLNRIY